VAPVRSAPGEKPARVRVLVADDDEDIRRLLAMVFELEPRFELVALVADVNGAVAAAAESRPDVAVVDARMPGGGGPRAIEQIHRYSPRTQVVAFSGDGDDRLEQMLLAGAVVAVTKGHGSIADLLQAVDGAARRASPSRPGGGGRDDQLPPGSFSTTA
jgi:DNA-binding NarL/FixJ family response regulator